ncbi:MAG: D-cysteine desulfhydrase family protein [Fusobacteriaceae bacterium]
MKIPNHIDIANLPTPIEKANNFSKGYNVNLYIKRDDYTGSEISGNKVRKLEFCLKEALDQGCYTLITCGGIQSNHARATAAVAARYNLKSHLVLRTNEIPKIRGNYFIDKLLGAKISFITKEEYSSSRDKIMAGIKIDLEKSGQKSYIIPEGASNGIGTFGYYKCYEEILEQEKKLGISFDTIVVPVGSGGTYAGLALANKLLNGNKKIVGVNVCDSAEYFKKVISDILDESIVYLKALNKEDISLDFGEEDIKIIDGYVGKGYALSSERDLVFLRNFAQSEGIVLDPVYTQKAMLGLAYEIRNSNNPILKYSKNILFIHTGGIFGLFPKENEFIF